MIVLSARVSRKDDIWTIPQEQFVFITISHENDLNLIKPEKYAYHKCEYGKNNE